MADVSAIDRFFDRLDDGIEAVDRVVNRHKHKAIDDARAARPAAPATTKALTRARFRVIEATDATSGVPVYVVTDGGGASCECATREMADRILRALESSP